MAVGSAEEDDGEVARGGGGHGRQERWHRGHGPLEHRVAPAQRCVHIQAAKVFADLLQILSKKYNKYIIQIYFILYYLLDMIDSYYDHGIIY